MNNTIPFKSTSRTIRSEQITVDVGILSVLNHAASPGRRELDSNIYLAAIAPDMELNIIMEEDAPHILPCFDEEDATIAIKGAPLFISYNPAQVLTLAGKHYLTGAVIFYRTDSSNHIVSLTVEDVYRFQSYLEMQSVTLVADGQELACICIPLVSKLPPPMPDRSLITARSQTTMRCCLRQAWHGLTFQLCPPGSRASCG